MDKITHPNYLEYFVYKPHLSVHQGKAWICTRESFLVEAKDQAWIGHVKSKSSTCCNIVLAP